jgi:hypothetical protein
MSLQDKLDAFRANFEAGGPPYKAPAWVHEPMQRATEKLIASSPDYTRRPDPCGLFPILNGMRAREAA